MVLSVAPYAPHRLARCFRLVLVTFVCLFVVFFLKQRSQSDFAVERYPAQRIPNYKCPCNKTDAFYDHANFSSIQNLTENRALVLVETLFSRHTKIITQILNASKYAFDIETFSKSLPILSTLEHGKYAFIVIDNYYKYLNMQSWNRQVLDKYCKEFNATIVAFIPSKPDDSFNRLKVKGSSLTLWQNQQVHNLTFSSKSLVPYAARPNVPINVSADSSDWVFFEQNAHFETVLFGKDNNGIKRSIIVRDLGVEDKIHRILIGHNISNWVIKLGFYDSVRFASKATFGFSLDRYIQIDVDDIFVGARGSRMIKSDVDALLDAQHMLSEYIQNFTFTLGFSGSYFLNGDDLEDQGDKRLLELASNFKWFCHMWRHNHAYDHNETYLESIMDLNKQFAINNNLPLSYGYSVSPQHAGVFPAHKALYEAWRKVWGVKVTTTEEYPHLRPASDRRGFIHKGIQVLPRQTCGLYTHTQHFHSYPDGFARLVENSLGGDLFFTVVFNPISIFMTHQQNFAHDRLAIWVFHNLVAFITCNTRLRLKWQDPVDSARAYFWLFPNEKTPIWSNPCVDPRHRAILPPAFDCSNMTLPNVLLVGPQKTGTTALAAFLALHPAASTNAPVAGTFEELQFFGGRHYELGLEWYINKFSPADVVFEKSATYFDHADVPRQVEALLPSAKIVVVLYDPGVRALSWYQHMLAHNDPAAANSTFEDILMAENGAKQRLRNRCISGGRYATHLDRWLQHFPASQIVLVDGEDFKYRPIAVMRRLIADLGLPTFDYAKVLRFSPGKGFWCSVSNGITKCLGKSKGRSYEPLTASQKTALNKIFHADNMMLLKLLKRLKQPIPKWLRKTTYEA